MDEYSEALFTMKKIDVKHTKQLAIDACNDIKEEIKRNQLKDSKKNRPQESAPLPSSSSSSSASKKPRSSQSHVDQPQSPVFPRRIASVTPGSNPSAGTSSRLSYQHHEISDELFEDSDQDENKKKTIPIHMKKMMKILMIFLKKMRLKVFGITKNKMFIMSILMIVF